MYAYARQIAHAESGEQHARNATLDSLEVKHFFSYSRSWALFTQWTLSHRSGHYHQLTHGNVTCARPIGI